MRARAGRRLLGVAVPVCVLALQAGCQVEETPDSSADAPGPAAASTDTEEAGVTDAPERRAGPAPCRSERSSWSVRDHTTRRLLAHGDVADIEVSRTGVATVAWTVSLDSGEIRTMDVPAAPGDPQLPAGPPDPEHRQIFHGLGDGVLGVDASGTQTLTWLSDPRGPSAGPSPFTEFFDVVVSERSPGGAWSSSPSVVSAGTVSSHQVAVNASGAAVLAWVLFGGRHPQTYAAYREAGTTSWTSPVRVAAKASLDGVGIDDAGRVVLAFRRDDGTDNRYAVRRTRAGRWTDPTRVAKDVYSMSLVVAADGSAVALTAADLRGKGGDWGTQVTRRMTPRGRWQDQVRHPDYNDVVFTHVLDVDARGRALLAWWDGPDLLSQSSRPDGRWSAPCVLARDVGPDAYLTPEARLSVNRQGDALVVWPAGGQKPHLRARFKPAGHGWSDTIRLRHSEGVADYYTADIGERGHAALAWVPRNGRQIHVVRTTGATIR